MGKLLLVAEFSPTDVGTHLVEAAAELGRDIIGVDSLRGFGRGRTYRRLARKLVGDWPRHALRFNRELQAQLQSGGIDCLLSTGKAPVLASTIRLANARGVRTVNYTTDDPWNRSVGTWWYRRALHEYGVIASPRSATIQQLQARFGGEVLSVPFAYSPSVHHASGEVDGKRELGDVLFVGYGDGDRAPFFDALHRAGVRPLLFGGGWQRSRSLRQYHHGYAGLEEQRRLYSEIPISVCLVRRANRDEHVMRTFEAAAMGACLVMEDTQEHRSFFGPDGEAVAYFNSIDSMVGVCRRLLADAPLRAQLRDEAVRRVRAGRHTYADRLAKMLGGETGVGS